MSAAQVYATPRVTLWEGDAAEVLAGMPAGSVGCIVTSPPYYWMRDYGSPEQIGLEATPQEYLAALLAVTQEMLRILAPDGTAWINIGDAYSQRKAVRRSSHQEGMHGVRGARPSWRESRAAGLARMSSENVIDGRAVPEKSMMMLPERLALGMIDQGWLLRNRVTWAKASTTPDPAPDRLPVRSEPVLMFSRGSRTWFDRSAMQQPSDVWTLPASSGGGAHKATYAPALPARCIALGCRPDGVVLDPFSGSGTTGVAALALGRRYVGIDVNRDYLTDSIRRLEAAA